MEYGIFALMSRRDLSRPAARILEEGIEQIVAAEELGFGAVWLAEHHFSSYSVIPNPLQLAVKLAERTKRIALGTGADAPCRQLRAARPCLLRQPSDRGQRRSPGIGLGRPP